MASGLCALNQIPQNPAITLKPRLLVCSPQAAAVSSEWEAPQARILDLPHLLAELLSFALAIAFSPLHIALLLLLLLGPDPLRRGGWFVAAWIAIAAVEMAVLLSVGHSLLLTMAKGSDHRTGLDLLADGRAAQHGLLP